MVTAIEAASDLLAGKMVANNASVCELRRQAKAFDKRRGGPGSADAKKYALGSTIALSGLDRISPTTLLGLFANASQFMRLLTQAATGQRVDTFADVIEIVLRDRDVEHWATQWGRIIQWRHLKPLHDAETARFMGSGKAIASASWRKRDVTDEQLFIIRSLENLLSEIFPNTPEHPASRGDAFDWIQARGGNPRFWQEPTIPTRLSGEPI